MKTRLPKLVDPGRLAARRETLSGELQAMHITRLATLYDISEPAEVRLDFSPDGFGRSAITGRFAAALKAECQRCLQPMLVKVEHEIDLKVIDLDQFSGDPAPTTGAKSEDIVEYRSKLNIFELLEDELVLATPIIPRHEANECGIPEIDKQPRHYVDSVEGAMAGNDDKMPLKSSAKEQGAQSGDTTRPFAGLAELLSSDE